MSVVAALGSLLDSAHPIDERPLSLFQGSSSAKAHSQPDAKKYAPIATIAAAVAIPNVDDTCDALLEPDAEADAADPFIAVDPAVVVSIPDAAVDASAVAAPVLDVAVETAAKVPGASVVVAVAPAV
uniref:Uncharacterized protein n=1 Tax=Phytophthora ramorum TaxID=164328 RepID=H3GZQ3_PHYRM